MMPILSLKMGFWHRRGAHLKMMVSRKLGGRDRICNALVSFACGFRVSLKALLDALQFAGASIAGPLLSNYPS